MRGLAIVIALLLYCLALPAAGADQLTVRNAPGLTPDESADSPLVRRAYRAVREKHLDAALQLMQQALREELARSSPPPVIAERYRDLCDVHVMRDEPDLALRDLLRARTLLEYYWGQYDQRLDPVLSQALELFRLKGDRQSLKRSLQQLIVIRGRAGNCWNTTMVRSIRELIHEFVVDGEYDQTEALLQEYYRAVVRDRSSTEEVCAGYLALGHAHLNTDVIKARRYYDLASQYVPPGPGGLHLKANAIYYQSCCAETLKQFDLAKKLARESIAIRLKLFGPDYLDTRVSFERLASCDILTGNLVEAERIYKQVLSTKSIKSSIGEETQVTYMLAGVLLNQRKYAEALPLYRKALALVAADKSGANRRLTEPGLALIKTCQSRLKSTGL